MGSWTRMDEPEAERQAELAVHALRDSGIYEVPACSLGG